ncbi:MAG TPA: hypothetical protein VMU25_04445 [Candidatus Paceibacterota bacterium]|nr:hypothetical protein [Candidatus Paceibacterota bacterium]
MSTRQKLFSSARRAGFVLFSTLLLVFSNTAVAYAGFGITPPYVKTDRLTRGSTYHQVINLVRSDPTEDLKADISMDIPGAQSWFSVDQGNEFIIPKGQTQMPITITVQVPKDAPYQEYTGAIRIRTSPANPSTNGTGVSIALGAQIDVDVKVVDKIYDFTVRRIQVADLEEGRRIWGLFFPGKIRLVMTIENTGNTVYGPTHVHMDIYDSQMETLLESTDNTNKIEQLQPFTIKDVVAELPTHLPAGSYIAKYTIYKGADIAQQNTVNLSISPEGTVIGYQGYGLDGLSLSDKLKVVGVLGVPALLFLILIVILIRKRRARRARVR